MSLPSIPIRSLSARLFWLAMLAGHLPATSAALAGDASALRAAILLLSQSFFVLKLLDVPWLRLPADRRRLIAVIAVIALLHARVVESSLPRDVNTYAAWHVVAVVGSVSAVALLLLVRRRAERLRRDSPPDQARGGQIAILSRLVDARVPPRFLLLLRACRVDRAPPDLPS